MPRKQTIQPDPLYRISKKDDDVVYEVYDDSCLPIGRGLHKVHAFNKKRDALLDDWVIKDYFEPGAPPSDYWVYKENLSERKDYLATASRFARWMEMDGDRGIEGKDDSALRKKLYPEITKQIRLFRNALSEAEGTSCAQNIE